MTRLTFREASRRKILLAALIFGGLFLIIYSVGFYLIRQEYNRSAVDFPQQTLMAHEMSNFLVMAGLYTVNFLTVMMTVLTSVDTLSGEITSGTIHTLVSKPVRRWEILLGKWLGYVGLLTIYLVMMAGGVVLAVFLISGYTPPNLLAGLCLMWLTCILLLSVSLFGGSQFSTLANGVMVFGLFGIAFIGGWIEQFGALVQNTTAINVGIISSLILPTEALWRRAAYEMQSPLSGVLGGATPFSAISVPSPLMIVYAGLYILVMLGLAVRIFGRRDL
jgi:ABC-type transport system involved in multi-copper enzyme maturation permease subunit